MKMNEPLQHRSVRDQVSADEWATRVDVAAAYRLVALYGWHDMIYNHISARVPGEEGAFLLNPFGFHYEEITASSLIKVDVDGRTLFNPNPEYTVNRAGFVIHSALHAGRPDLGCVIHTHTVAGMAVSNLKCGILPLNQSILKFPKIAYHAFEGLAVDLDERKRLVEDMGDCEVMVLRNHGLLAAGRTVPEAFNNIYRMERAAVVQLQTMACNTEINLLSPEVIQKVNSQFVVNEFAYNPATSTDGKAPVMGVSEWPALLRMLDRRDASYKD